MVRATRSQAAPLTPRRRSSCSATAAPKRCAACRPGPGAYRSVTSRRTGGRFIAPVAIGVHHPLALGVHHVLAVVPFGDVVQQRRQVAHDQVALASEVTASAYPVHAVVGIVVL